jgi:hypothetical protein
MNFLHTVSGKVILYSLTTGAMYCLVSPTMGISLAVVLSTVLVFEVSKAD